MKTATDHRGGERAETETEETHECTFINALSRQPETYKQKLHGNTLRLLPLSLSLFV